MKFIKKYLLYLLNIFLTIFKIIILNIHALNFAAQRNNQKIINFLLQKGIDIIDNCFIFCHYLTHIKLPSITSYKNSIFRECVSLESIFIPPSVTIIDDSAFLGCLSLKNVSLPSSVIYIGTYAFSECKSLINISIPSSVVTIDKNAFRGCCSLINFSFELPSSLMTIGEWAFATCSSLTSISIPKSVTKIGDDAFHGCKSLKNVLIPSEIDHSYLGIKCEVKKV